MNIEMLTVYCPICDNEMQFIVAINPANHGSSHLYELSHLYRCFQDDVWVTVDIPQAMNALALDEGLVRRRSRSESRSSLDDPRFQRIKALLGNVYYEPKESLTDWRDEFDNVYLPLEDLHNAYVDLRRILKTGVQESEIWKALDLYRRFGLVDASGQIGGEFSSANDWLAALAVEIKTRLDRYKNNSDSTSDT